MNDQPVEIVLVEDNPYDVELTLSAFKTHHLVNRIKVMPDRPSEDRNPSKRD